MISLDDPSNEIVEIIEDKSELPRIANAKSTTSGPKDFLKVKEQVQMIKNSSFAIRSRQHENVNLSLANKAKQLRDNKIGWGQSNQC